MIRSVSLWPKWARNIETVHFHFPRSINHPQHGPTRWPWWKVLAIRPYRNGAYAPSIGWNIWVYTRWGSALVFELYVGRGLSRTENWPKMQPYQVVELRQKVKAVEKLWPDWKFFADHAEHNKPEEKRTVEAR